jgi:hypothetical protein
MQVCFYITTTTRAPAAFICVVAATADAVMVSDIADDEGVVAFIPTASVMIETYRSISDVYILVNAVLLSVDKYTTGVVLLCKSDSSFI